MKGCGQAISSHQTFFFKENGAENLAIKNHSAKAATFLLIAGDPLKDQEVHRQERSVAASKAGIRKAFVDHDTYGEFGRRSRCCSQLIKAWRQHIR